MDGAEDPSMEEVHTVFRAKEADLDSLNTKLLAMVHAGKPKKEIDKIIEQMKVSCNYSGSYFKNYFKVNHPVSLLQLGFYGPFDAKQAEYSVHVQVFAPRKAKQMLPESDSRCQIGEACVKVSGTKREIFYVGFNDGPVYIEPGIWYMIEFTLDGPKTLRASETLSTATVFANGKTIEFEFVAGSMQMPCMRFKLAPFNDSALPEPKSRKKRFRSKCMLV